MTCPRSRTPKPSRPLLAPSEYEGGRAGGYLDTATYGLPPRRTVVACEAALAGWQNWEDWHRWEEDGEACRELFARIVRARPGEVAILPAVSVAAGLVGASIEPQRGTNIVVYEQEFHSNLFPWLALEQRGVEVRLAPLDGMADAVDEGTVLAAVSLVQSRTGAVADLDALRATGVCLFVDATQAVGAIPIDLDGIDYLAAGAYKWLLCPRGLSFFRVRPERLEELEPRLAGWKARSDPYAHFYGPPLDLADDARRLDVSLAWFSAAGARPSLELIAELGAQRIADHDLALARLFCTDAGLPEPKSPIVRVEVADAEEALARLRRASVQAAGRAGALRLSFHLYNDTEDVARALEALQVFDYKA